MLKTLFASSLVLFLQAAFYLNTGNSLSACEKNTLTQKKKETNFNISEASDNDILFVVKHCKSPNIVVYKAKRDEKKDFDALKPIDVYWLKNTKGKKTEALTYIEWKMAFGFELHTLSKGKKYKISLNAIKNKEIVIKQSDEGVPESIMQINGVQAKLKEVYIKFEPSLVIPNVEYVDFKGFEIGTGRVVVERITNK